MLLGISPTVDFAFKLILGSPEHTAITVHFLNAVLGGSPRIKQATILNPILGKETEEDKLAMLDILAKDEFGRQFNIEMQTSLPMGLSQRLVYYASSVYVGQLTAGAEYDVLRPVMSICVLERPMFPQIPQLHLDFRLRDSKGLLLTDDLQIHLIELSKSRATEHNIREVSPLEHWAFFLRNAERLSAEAVRRLLTDPEFDEAVGVLEMIKKSPEQLALYDARLKFQRDEAARLKYARWEGQQEGWQGGRQEGEQIGEQKGIIVGELLGQIRLFQQLLGMPQTASDELKMRNTDQLTAVLNDLQRQFQERKA